MPMNGIFRNERVEHEMNDDMVLGRRKGLSSMGLDAVRVPVQAGQGPCPMCLGTAHKDGQ